MFSKISCLKTYLLHQKKLNLVSSDMIGVILVLTMKKKRFHRLSFILMIQWLKLCLLSLVSLWFDARINILGIVIYSPKIVWSKAWIKTNRIIFLFDVYKLFKHKKIKPAFICGCSKENFAQDNRLHEFKRIFEFIHRSNKIVFWIS